MPYITYHVFFMQYLMIRYTVDDIQHPEGSVTFIWPFNVIQGQGHEVNWKIIMTSYICFVETLVIACNVSEILAQIDHKVPNWTFLTLKMTFKMTRYHSKLRTVLVSPPKKLHYAIKLGSTSVLLNNIEELCENEPNSTFLTLKMTCRVIQSNPYLHSWSISSPRSCTQQIKKSY